jgi:hypothetical protein
MNYERGFKRIYAVLAVCWIAVYIPYLINISRNNGLPTTLAFALGVVLQLTLAYLFCFRIVPWIIKGFR